MAVCLLPAEAPWACFPTWVAEHDTYGVATNGPGGITILMSGPASRATASTLARPCFVKCLWVLSRGGKWNRPVILVAPSHLVTVAVTCSFPFFRGWGDSSSPSSCQELSQSGDLLLAFPRTLRISKAARCADPLRDCIMMQRHCTLGELHTGAVGCKRVAHGWTAVSCMSWREALLSALRTASEDPPVIRRQRDRLSGCKCGVRLCLRKRFVSHFLGGCVQWDESTQQALRGKEVRILSEEVTFERSLWFKLKFY